MLQWVRHRTDNLPYFSPRPPYTSLPVGNARVMNCSRFCQEKYL